MAEEQEGDFSVVLGDVGRGGTGGSYASATSPQAFICKMPLHWSLDQAKNHLVEVHPKKYKAPIDYNFLSWLVSSFPPSTPSLTIVKSYTGKVEEYQRDVVENREDKTVKEHLKTMERPVIKLEADELRREDDITGSTLLREIVTKVHSKLPEHKRTRPVFLLMTVYDDAVSQQVKKENKEEMEKTIADFNELVERSKKMATAEDIFQMLRALLTITCPYHYVNFSDKKFIEKNQKDWKDKKKTLQKNFMNFVKSKKRKRRIDFSSSF